MKNVIVAVSGLVVLASGFALNASPAEAQQRGAPRGSYTQSCSNAYVNQGRLYADCYDERGSRRSTSIEVGRCGNYDVANRNGLLVCGNIRGTFENNGRPGNNNRPGWNGRPDDNNRPGGPGRPGDHWNNSNSSITVYRESNFRGRPYTVNRAVPDMRELGLNDAVNSLRISRGAWEVCEHSNYRGQCRTFSSNVEELRRYSMANKISSMRPVQGGRR